MKANYKTSKRGLRKEAGIIEEAMIACTQRADELGRQ